jgi:hypothetical protein
MRVVLACLIVVLLTGVGCGDGEDGASGSQETPAAQATAAPEVSSEERAVLEGWAQATTPAERCELMTAGFKEGAAGGDSGCEAWIEEEFGELSAADPEIVSVTKTGDQTAVGITTGTESAVLYLAEECGEVKVNSIGEERPVRPGAC